MGHKDLENLQLINREIFLYNLQFEWKFRFKVDDGDYETRIDINEDGYCFKGNGQLPLTGYEMFCPDLLDFNKKLIIEFEEEAGKKRGYFGAAYGKRGHTEYTNTRDTERDLYYSLAHFTMLKLWESDMKTTLWQRKLQSFLLLQSKYPLC